MLTYPLAYNSLYLDGPTLIYLDEEGTPIQLQLSNEQVQAIVNDQNVINNAINDNVLEEGATPCILKPPQGHVVTIYVPQHAS